MGPVIRRAEPADIPAMHDVRLSVRENVLRSPDVTEASYGPAIEGSGRGWVAEQDGRIVGFAIADRDSGNIWALFVHPDHQGRGHGRALHATMMRWLSTQAVRRAWLTTEPGTRAERFYRSAGWRLAQMLPNGEAEYEIRPRYASDPSAEVP